MRVIECDECGETLTAENDEELGRRLTAHMRGEHDRELSGEEAEELIADEAYDAMDS